MRFLLLNQAFYPDVMATGQYLTEVAVALADRGHEVTVVTGRRGYDRPGDLFAREEIWRGVRILRVDLTGFGKATRWRRAADFVSFLLACSWRVLRLRKHDVVVALSSPPLICLLGACLGSLWRCRFVYWVMDLNPDEAVAAGWLGPDSAATRMLERASRFSLGRADRVIVLDRFMRERVLRKGIPEQRVVVLPLWFQDGIVAYDAAGRERFRTEHGLGGKFVVMHAGNHSPCHPLNTLLDAACVMAGDKDVVFCFVGGGSVWREMRGDSECRKWRTVPEDTPGASCSARMPELPSNLKWVSYQPLEKLSASLSAADLHVVVMGDGLVGVVHPCKIYNALGVGAPVLYIGPEPSHVSELLSRMKEPLVWRSAGHFQVAKVVQGIRDVQSRAPHSDRAVPELLRTELSSQTVLPRLLSELGG